MVNIKYFMFISVENDRPFNFGSNNRIKIRQYQYKGNNVIDKILISVDFIVNIN